MDLERRLIWAIIAATVLLTTIPVLAGYAIQGESNFMGLAMGISDVNTYFDLMNQASRGHFFFINSYTTESMPALLISPIHFIMGLFTIILPSIMVWHLFRIALIIIFILLFYRIVSGITDDSFIRITATAIVSLGSGMGLFISIWNSLGIKYFGSVDLWVPEAIPFLSMTRVPMYVFSLIMLLLSIFLFKKAMDDKSPKYMLLAALASNILASEHIFDIAPLFTTCGGYMVYSLWKKQQLDLRIITLSIAYVALSCIVPLYFVYIFFFVPAYQGWTAQNILSSPPITNYIFGLGIPLYLSLYYIITRRTQIKQNKNLSLLTIWMITNIILLYVPVDFQRRFVEGLFIPISILAAFGLKHILQRFNIHRAAAIIAIILISSTNLFMVWQLSQFRYDASSMYSAPYFLDDDELQALEYLNTLDIQNIILADPKLSNYIPRISGHRVYVGHWTQTSDFIAKEQWYSSKEFFTKEDLSSRDIDYLLIDTPQPDLQQIRKFDSLYMYAP